MPKTAIVEVKPAIVKELDRRVSSVQKKSETYVTISNRAEYDKANDFALVVKKLGEDIDAERKSITVPLKTALDNANDIYQPRVKKCAELVAVIKDAMSAFLREEDRKAQEEEARLLALREKKDEKREAQGKAPLATPLPTVQAPQTNTQGKAGGSVAAKEWKFRIVSVKDIPQEYLQQTMRLAIEKGLLDVVMRNALKAGIRKIKGVEIYEDFKIAMTTKKDTL